MSDVDCSCYSTQNSFERIVIYRLRGLLVYSTIPQLILFGLVSMNRSIGRLIYIMYT